MLTGDKDTDLQLLTLAYNNYGTNVLTPNHDVNHCILNYLDIISLINFCTVSKKTIQLCNDKTFWKNKFRIEDLSIMDEPDKINEWIKMYNIAYQAKKDIRRLMIINELQHNDIIVSGEKMWLLICMGVRTYDKRIIKIYIKKNQDNYTFVIDNQLKKYTKINLIAFLIRIQYLVLEEHFMVNIFDDNSNPILIKNLNVNPNKTMLIRYNMIKTIIFLENTSDKWWGDDEKIFY